MRFPLTHTLKIAGHILRHRLRRTRQFATVLQLEPLHTCNLTCTGCGRIREYSTSIKDVMPLADCLAAAAECDAPMVSICGGEPLIYPHIGPLVRGLHAQGRIAYLCTNGTKMRAVMRDWLRSHASVEPAWVAQKVRILDEEGLITRSHAEGIFAAMRQPVDAPSGIAPHRDFYWNVHLDGMEATHDSIVERPGVFAECMAAIRMAKHLGYRVVTNTTVYRETDPDEIESLLLHLAGLRVDGHTLSPGYDYDAAKRDMLARLGRDPGEFFLTRDGTRQKFARAVQWGWRFPVLGTPAYLEFLAGLRELPCSAWAIPTCNIRGWKGPCYLMTDGHYRSYAELLQKTDWSRLGHGRDARCENCMVHCGYEPSAALGIAAQSGDLWKTLRFTFGPKPRPSQRASLQKPQFTPSQTPVA